MLGIDSVREIFGKDAENRCEPTGWRISHRFPSYVVRRDPLAGGFLTIRIHRLNYLHILSEEAP